MGRVLSIAGRVEVNWWWALGSFGLGCVIWDYRLKVLDPVVVCDISSNISQGPKL